MALMFSRSWLNTSHLLRGVRRQNRAWRLPAHARCYQASSGIDHVPLAFELLEPSKGPKNGYDNKNGPILFLHGFLGSRKNNRTVSRVIARDLGRYVYIIDLRNHGDSPHHHRHDYPAMAHDVAEFIREHGLTESSIIGHSMGAKTAMSVALGSPELVKDFVAVDNAPVDATVRSDFGTYIHAMKKIEDAGVTRQDEADNILKPYEESLPIRQFLLGNLYRLEGSQTRKFRVPLDILAKCIPLMGEFPFKDPEMVRFEKPALFVRGTQSHYVPDEVLPIIGQFFPRFELVDIEAGHWVTAEKPDEFAKATVEFLEPRD